MAKRKPIKGKKRRKPTTAKRKTARRTKRKITVGEFSAKKKGEYKRRKIKGKTELRRYKKGDRKGQVKSVSLILYNKRRKDDVDSLENFANDIQNDNQFFSKLNEIFYRNRVKPKGRGKKKLFTILPFSAVVIVEQKDRDYPSQYHYEPYFMQPPATKENIRNHTINTVRNHAEFIRQQIIKRGIFRQGRTAENYEFSNFKPWYVPSIRIELLYE